MPRAFFVAILCVGCDVGSHADAHLKLDAWIKHHRLENARSECFETGANRIACTVSYTKPTGRTVIEVGCGPNRCWLAP